MFKFIRKRFLLILISILGLSVNVAAQNAVKLTDPSGNELILLLETTPTVTIEGDYLCVSSDEKDFSFLFDGTFTVEFCDDNAGVEEIEQETTSFKITPNILEAKNLDPDSFLFIYDISGKKVKSATADPSGFVSIDISEMGRGIYIVNTKKNNFKFQKI